MDLSNFQELFDLPSQKVAVSIGSHRSDAKCLSSKGESCAEANLDVQYIMVRICLAIYLLLYYCNGHNFDNSILIIKKNYE